MITVSSTTDTQKEAQQAADATPLKGAPATSAPPQGGTESAEVSETSEPTQQTKEGKDETVSDRIRELTYRRREAERERDEKDAKLRQLEAELAKTRTPPSAPNTAVPDKEPDPLQFKTYDEYIRATVRYDRAQDEKRKAEEEKQRQQDQEVQRIRDSWSAKVAKGRTAHADFDAVTQTAVASETMKLVILESEHGDELAYWLGKHPEDAQRIAAMTPYAAAREMAKVEETLAQSAEQRPAANAPPEPIRPVGASRSTTHKDPSTMSFQEYKRWRSAGGGR